MRAAALCAACISSAHPCAETKLVRCTRGAVFDVLLDLRPGSATYHHWHAAELTMDNGAALHIPVGCAHGFQSPVDDFEVFYQISQSHRPDAAVGVRWDDPVFGIEWPIRPPILSDRDARISDLA